MLLRRRLLVVALSQACQRKPRLTRGGRNTKPAVDTQAAAGVRHVDFFSLDVEGGELSQVAQKRMVGHDRPCQHTTEPRIGPFHAMGWGRGGGASIVGILIDAARYLKRMSTHGGTLNGVRTLQLVALPGYIDIVNTL